MGVTLKGFVSGAKKLASRAGRDQVKRVKNVGAVLKAAVTGNVKSNTGIKVLDKALSSIASHPFVTAAVGGTVANIPKAVRLAKSSAGSSSGLLAKTGSSLRNKGATGSTARPGLSTAMDMAPSANSNAPGLVRPPEATGGLANKVVDSSGGASSTVKKRRRSSTSSPRRKRRSSSRKRRKTRRSSKKRYGSAKQYARKGGKSVHYTKNGQAYILKANGQARFVKGHRR